MTGQRPCGECGSTECGDSDFVILGIPAWAIALAAIIATAAAVLAYTYSVR